MKTADVSYDQFTENEPPSNNRLPDTGCSAAAAFCHVRFSVHLPFDICEHKSLCQTKKTTVLYRLARGPSFESHHRPA